MQIQTHPENSESGSYGLFSSSQKTELWPYGCSSREEFSSSFYNPNETQNHPRADIHSLDKRVSQVIIRDMSSKHDSLSVSPAKYQVSTS